MRMFRRIRASVFVALALAFPYAAVAQPKPPTTEKKPHVTKIHGDTLVDNYFWLREKTNPDVIAHLEAENAYTAAMTADTLPIQQKLYAEMLGHIKQTDVNVPLSLPRFRGRVNSWATAVVSAGAGSMVPATLTVAKAEP